MSTLTPGQREIVRKARELIALPERWLKGAEARARDGGYARAIDAHAYRFCLVGALVYANGGYGVIHSQLYSALTKHLGYGPWGRLSDFNDVSTHARVLAFLDDVLA